MSRVSRNEEQRIYEVSVRLVENKRREIIVVDTGIVRLKNRIEFRGVRREWGRGYRFRRRENSGRPR